MNALDIAILIVVAFGIFLGVLSGLVWQVARILIVAVSVYAALYLHPPVGRLLATRMNAAAVANVIAYVLVFASCYAILSLAAWLAERPVRGSGLDVYDRILGGAFGGVKACLICGAILIALACYPTPQSRALLGSSEFTPFFVRTMARIVVAAPVEIRGRMDRYVQRLAVEAQAGRANQTRELAGAPR